MSRADSDAVNISWRFLCRQTQEDTTDNKPRGNNGPSRRFVGLSSCFLLEIICRITRYTFFQPRKFRRSQGRAAKRQTSRQEAETVRMIAQPGNDRARTLTPGNAECQVVNNSTDHLFVPCKPRVFIHYGVVMWGWIVTLPQPVRQAHGAIVPRVCGVFVFGMFRPSEQMPFLLLLPPSALVKFRKKSVSEHSFSVFYERCILILECFVRWNEFNWNWIHPNTHRMQPNFPALTIRRLTDDSG